MTKKEFRTILALSLVFLLVAGVVILFFNQTLPPELGAFVEAGLEEDFTFIEILGFVVALLAVAANIGLLFFARWSRPVFAAGVVASCIVTAFNGPFVATALEESIYEVGLLLDGFIIALTYFSDAKVYFESKVI